MNTSKCIHVSSFVEPMKRYIDATESQHKAYGEDIDAQHEYYKLKLKISDLHAKKNSSVEKMSWNDFHDIEIDLPNYWKDKLKKLQTEVDLTSARYGEANRIAFQTQKNAEDLIIRIKKETINSMCCPTCPRVNYEKLNYLLDRHETSIDISCFSVPMIYYLDAYEDMQNASVQVNNERNNSHELLQKMFAVMEYQILAINENSSWSKLDEIEIEFFDLKNQRKKSQDEFKLAKNRLKKAKKEVSRTKKEVKDLIENVKKEIRNSIGCCPTCSRVNDHR